MISLTDSLKQQPVITVSLSVVILLFLLLFVVYPDAFQLFIGSIGNEDYSHAILIPFITGYLIWEKRHSLTLEPGSDFKPIILATFGLLLLALSYLANFKSVYGYSIILVAWAVIWFIAGNKSTRKIIIPLALLFFIVPMPVAVHNAISYKLQLVSTDISVEILRWLKISVYQEGNVIDLGSVKLQVVEACSGLRYLLPLIVLAIIISIFYKAPLWRKLMLVVSAIPIAVITNSIRIAINGILVDYVDPSLAEGFSHDFQGWLVFLSAFSILLFEVWFIEKIIFNNPISLRQELSDNVAEPLNTKNTKLGLIITLIIIMFVGLIASKLTSLIPEADLKRSSFSSFPLKINNWTGTISPLKDEYLPVLNLDDYFQGDFVDNLGDTINVYIPYWEDTNTDWYFHNPEVCLPGGGWITESSGKIDIKTKNGQIEKVNRVVMSMGDARMVVYYWFQMRGRVVDDHLMIKPYTVIDHISRGRSDGALVRLINFIQDDEKIDNTDQKLTKFTSELLHILPSYVPD